MALSNEPPHHESPPSTLPPEPDLDLDLGAVYRGARHRLTDLVRARAADAGTWVPACPDWSVHDVVAHLVAVAEDALAGRLTGIPSDEETARQVGQRQGTSTESVLDAWGEIAPAFEAFLSQQPVWPAALDVLSHEQDVRGTLAEPGARDDPGLLAGARLLVAGLRVPARLEVHLDGTILQPTPSDDADEHRNDQGQNGPDVDTLVLTTTAFETFRFRLGRRSRRQLLALDWQGDPTSILAHLTIFGPSPHDIDE